MNFTIYDKINKQIIFKEKLKEFICLKSNCYKTFCIGYPYCKEHTKEKFYVEIKSSNFLKNELGVFAIKDLYPEDLKLPYIGEKISKEELIKRYKYNMTTIPYGTAFKDPKTKKKDYIDFMIKK